MIILTGRKRGAEGEGERGGREGGMPGKPPVTLLKNEARDSNKKSSLGKVNGATTFSCY